MKLTNNFAAQINLLFPREDESLEVRIYINQGVQRNQLEFHLNKTSYLSDIQIIKVFS